MQQYFSFLLAVCLIFSITLLAFEKANGQSNQQVNLSGTDTLSQTPAAKAAYVSGITAGRARALAGGAVALISLIIGWRAKAGSAVFMGNASNAATVAVVLGCIAVVFSVIHLAITAGAVFGSGSGKAGAIVALIPGVIGIMFGWGALRNKKAGQ
jgi:hypothetical protein